MAKKLTRLICYKLLKEVYGDRPQPDWRSYEIELLRKATRMWFHWNEDESKWILKSICI